MVSVVIAGAFISFSTILVSVGVAVLSPVIIVGVIFVTSATVGVIIASIIILRACAGRSIIPSVVTISRTCVSLRAHPPWPMFS